MIHGSREGLVQIGLDCLAFNEHIMLSVMQ
ncbi:hypothetical protein SAMN05444972_110131 [Marininema halotolerans]|uniref:Uncharacterized protein n=1 Tax=Marininema halotolerans TaxID=1155944 RepID=A0A1I6TM35_9BACL|nr:hypothetical protein SAMN05444972_110131 [Marininema halotolerans]